ncbi:1,3-propanediol dehydrogenase [Castellaniella defragrans]
MTMTNATRRFSYHIPTAIEFGFGALQCLPALVQNQGGTKVLVVGDHGVVAAGVMRQVCDVLQVADIPTVVFEDIVSDPDVQSVDSGVDQAKAQHCDLVVGVGGGSSMDTAKAIGLMLGNPGNIRDYVGMGRAKQPGAPVIAIPTTSGTGSEMTIWSVLSDRAKGVKISVGSVFNCARIALLDPELTLTLPPSVTAQTGMDALTHAIESYVCTATQPISEGMSEQAIALIARNLRVAVAQPHNRDARGNMLLASTIAAMAFNSTRLGLVHAFAMPLGAKYHIGHGLVNAIMLPHVMRFNIPGSIHKSVRIAQLLGEVTDGLALREAADRSVSAVECLKRDIGITETLSAFDASEDDFDAIVNEAMTSGNVPVNPRQPTHGDMKMLLRQAM